MIISEGNTSIEITEAGDEITATVSGVLRTRVSSQKALELNVSDSDYPDGIWIKDYLMFYSDPDTVSRCTSIGKLSGGANAGDYPAWDGFQDVCIGQAAGQKLTTGSSNVFVGVKTGSNITDSTNNVVLGTAAMYGGSGSANTALGTQALQYGDKNNCICIGLNAGRGDYHVPATTLDNCIFIGNQSGDAIEDGDDSIFIGYECGRYLTGTNNELYIENSSDDTYPLIYGQFGTSSENKLCVGTSTVRTTTVGLTVRGEIAPATDNVYDLGNSSYRWNDIYATNATIQTSDARQKLDIKESDLGLDFICELTPVSFKWREDTIEEVVISYESYEDIEERWADTLEEMKMVIDRDEDYEEVDGRYRMFKEITKQRKIETPEIKKIKHSRKHYGLTAQDVKSVLEKKEISTDDFAGYIYDKEVDKMGLRYSEFIAPMIRAIQELKEENDILKERLSRLESAGVN